MDDTISRQKAIEHLKEHRRIFCKDHMEFTILSDKDKARVDEIDNCIATLINLPSAQSKRNRGKWRHYEGYLTCSECRTEYDDDIMTHCCDDVPKFCPNCGADMRGEQE